MTKYEYKIVQVPQVTSRPGWLRKSADPLGQDVTGLLNELGAFGWEYVRSETLITTRKRFMRAARTHEHKVMVFRRVIGQVARPEAAARVVLTEPKAVVQPRRVRNADAVARVKAGARRITPDVGAQGVRDTGDEGPIYAAE